jgi:hypothetical protein
VITFVSNTVASFGWGWPAAGVRVITRTPPRMGSPGIPTSYVYEQNAVLNDGTIAPGKRGQFYTPGELVLLQSAESWRLFDAMVNWARQ